MSGKKAKTSTSQDGSDTDSEKDYAAAMIAAAEAFVAGEEEDRARALRVAELAARVDHFLNHKDLNVLMLEKLPTLVVKGCQLPGAGSAVTVAPKPAASADATAQLGTKRERDGDSSDEGPERKRHKP